MKVFALKSPAPTFLSSERKEKSGPWLRAWPLLALLCATLLPLLPIIRNGAPTGADMTNHYRFGITFYDALRAGHLYPSWLAASNSGFGDPSVRFYPPALYYLMSASRALFGDWYDATLPVFAVLTFIGVLGAYFWARSFVAPRYAVWAGLFYAIAPYRVNESLENFLLAEYAGGAALVFAFAFLERVCSERRWRDVVGLGAAYAMLILTHLPLTVMGSLMLCLYALMRIERSHFWATVSRLSLGVLLGLAASARYWVMMVSELGWIRAGRVAPSGWYDYRNNFLFSEFSYNTSTWWTNYIALATVAMFIPVFVLCLRKRRDVLGLSVLAVLSFFMTTGLSKPLWVIIPRLKDIQFPWRWLALTSAACSVLMAVALPVWVEKLRGTSAATWRKVAIVASGFVLLSVCFLATHFMERAYYYDRAKFYEELAPLDGLRSHKDWWPVWVKGDQLPREMSGNVEAEGRDVSVTSWTATQREFKVSGGDVTEARVRALYYPNWAASAGGEKLPTRASEDGALLVTLPKDAATIELEFREPLRVQAAMLVTAAGWILILGFLIFNRSKPRCA